MYVKNKIQAIIPFNSLSYYLESSDEKFYWWINFPLHYGH